MSFFLFSYVGFGLNFTVCKLELKCLKKKERNFGWQGKKKKWTEREEKVHVNDIRHCAIEVEAKSLCVKEKTREARGVSMPSHDGFFTLCIYSIALFFLIMILIWHYFRWKLIIIIIYQNHEHEKSIFFLLIQFIVYAGTNQYSNFN